MNDVRVTAAEAAAEVGVKRGTIDQWVARGWLSPIPGSGRPARFWLSQVFEAEAGRRVHWKQR